MMNTVNKAAKVILSLAISLTMVLAPGGTSAISAVTAETEQQRRVREAGIEVEWLEIDGFTSLLFNSREGDSNLCIIYGRTEDNDSTSGKRGFIDTNTAAIVIPLYNKQKRALYRSGL